MRDIRLPVFATFLALGTMVPAQDAAPGVARLPPVIVSVDSVASARDVQTIPAAVTRLGRDELRAAGIESLQDLPAAAPNLTLSQSTAPAFGDIYAVRGVANTEFFSDPALVLYIDDSPAGDAMSYPPDLLDLAGIDIWRGPQGTRFGKNSAAGVIELTTRKPGDAWEGSASASLASRDTALYRAGVLGPILPGELRFSLSGSHGRSDGFIDNPLRGGKADASERTAGRLYLSWIPGPDWDVSLTATADEYDGGISLVPADGPHDEVSSDVDQAAESSANAQVLRLRGALPGGLFTSITTRRDYSMDPLLLDIDLSPVPGNTALIRQDEALWSEELRLQSPTESADWRWLGGLYLDAVDRDGDDVRNFIAPVAPGVYAPVQQRTLFTLEDENYAVFGEATYAGIDRLGITVGARLDYAIRRIERSRVGGRPVADLDDEDSFFNAAPKITVEYTLADHLLGYVSSGLGFKPGGYSAYIDPPKSPSFDTERNWTSEAGLKSEWLDGKLLANLAAFHNDISDYQVEHDLIGSTDRTVVNAPAVTSRGMELELICRPLRGLELSAGAGFTDIQFDDYDDPDTGASLDGKRPPYVPEFDARAAVQYRATCGGFARVEYQAVGKTYFDERNTDAMKESGYGLIDARIGYETADYSICLFGCNLADEEYFSRRLVLADIAGVPGAPRTIGAQVGLTF